MTAGDGKVSVIIPVYRVEKLLDRCVDAVTRQTYRNLEIILVDDGSPDGCGQICEERALKDGRIRVLHKRNAGLGMARNSGLEVATGEYVAFVDSDDWVLPDYVESLLRAMLDAAADLAVGGFTRVRADGSRSLRPATERRTVVERDEIIPKLLLPMIGAAPEAAGDVETEMCVWRNLYRWDTIESLGLRFVSEREYVSEDIFFNMLYLLRAKRAVLVPGCPYCYTVNAESLTNTYRPDRFDRYGEMLALQTKILQENGLLEAAEMRLYRTYLMKTKKCLSLLAKSDLGFRAQWAECRRMMRHPNVRRVLAAYPNDRRAGRAQRGVVALMKARACLALLALYRIRNRRRGSAV